MIEILYLAVGLVLLWKSGDFLVEGASAIAKKRGVSDLVIGLTLIAFGTSAPELVVNTIASWQNKPDIILGNVLGNRRTDLSDFS
jgi:cation:H+ antiporter